VSPENAQQLAEAMAEKHAHAEKLSLVDLRQMNRVLELAPEDMTVTVEAGISLGALQRELATHRQWLPIDPPNAENVSIHEVLSRDLNGPRRFGCGTIREHLIGMKVVLADGRSIKSGGKVVKNVAGYDLAKLFIGARDSLGIIVEATFKLRPLPEEERIVGRQISVLAELKPAVAAVLNSDLTPIILDAHCRGGDDGGRISIALGFAGTHEEVEWQSGRARALGFDSGANLEYETQFWNDPAAVHRTSVLPSRLMEVIAELGARPFVARAGNGVVYYRGQRIAQKDASPVELAGRIKSAYDPKNILHNLTA
jgi:FAD/FMN-containing dehydrogenase